LKVERTASLFNNYKHYTSKHLHRLQQIIKAKSFGFTLNEIADLLELIDSKSANCSVLQEKIDDKIRDINRRIQEFQDFKSSIIKEIQIAQKHCLASNEIDNCKLLE